MKLKLDGIMKSSNRLIKLMKHEQKLKEYFGNFSLFKVVIENNDTWQNFAFIINIILNFMIMLSYKGWSGDHSNDSFNVAMNEPKLLWVLGFDIDSETTNWTIRIVGIINLIFSFLVVFNFQVKTAWIIYESA